MTKYAGLCVGGPAAKQLIVNHSSTLAIDERPAALSLASGPGEVPETVTVTRTIYEHHEVAGIGLWVPATDRLATAIETLALAYVDAASADLYTRHMQGRVARAALQTAIAAVIGISDDYQTSEHHHPGHVLIPLAKFEHLQSAEAMLAALSTSATLDNTAVEGQ